MPTPRKLPQIIEGLEPEEKTYLSDALAMIEVLEPLFDGKDIDQIAYAVTKVLDEEQLERLLTTVARALKVDYILDYIEDEDEDIENKT